MPRKIGISITVKPEQVDWLDAQDEANSKVVRTLIDEARGEA